MKHQLSNKILPIIFSVSIIITAFFWVKSQQQLLLNSKKSTLIENQALPSINLGDSDAGLQKTKPELAEDLTKAYGFCMGQTFSLERIKKEFPNLTIQVKKVELEFANSFGIAERGIKKALQELFKDKYIEFENNMTKQLQTVLSTQKLSKDNALNFLSEVENRIKGKIQSPILETLLTYQFADHPEDEFSRGYTKVYRTLNHDKAKGIDFQIQYPSSWSADEGHRPNIIQKFISENGRGYEMLILIVKDIPNLTSTPTEKELSELFSDKELRTMIPENSKLVSSKSIILDRHKGGMMVFDQTIQRLDVSIPSRCLQFVTIYKNKAIFIQCMVGGPQFEKDINLETRFKHFEPL